MFPVFEANLTITLSRITVSIFLLFGLADMNTLCKTQGRNELRSTVVTWNITPRHAWSSVQLWNEISHDGLLRLTCPSACCFWNVYKCKQILSSTIPFFDKKFWIKGQHDSLWFKNTFQVLGDSWRSQAFSNASFSTDFLFCCGEGFSVSYWVLHLKS